MNEDITDIKYDESFVLAYEHGILIGVLGFDADINNSSAEIWGPFINEDKWEIAFDMWIKMLELLPNEVNSLYMFPNNKNKRVLKLSSDLDFNEHGKQSILKFHRDNKGDLNDVSIIELTQKHYLEMKELHDKTFPGTYYSGSQIIEKINGHRKVFIIRSHDNLSGYIYVEAQPEFGEASIEFFAVNESERGKGIGRELLSVALKWIFTFDTIDSITLCVNTINDNAIGLYRKVGFNQIHDLRFLSKKI